MNDFKIILDSPSQTPALGFDQTAAALREIIEGSKPQFVIGIFGTWGSGKTTLMRSIERQLDPQKTIAIQFSAWRYEKEAHLIIPLLDVVREGLVKWAKKNKAFKTNAVATASTIGNVIYSLMAGLNVKVGLPHALEVSYDANKALAKAKDLDDESNAASVPRSFYHAAFRALDDSFNEFLKQGPADRIVVFVDDLDRCLPQGAREVLEAMKLFFDMEGYIFVVGLDQSVVERSIDLKYRNDGAATNETGYQIRGADYIKKIFQVPFSIAPVAIAQLDEFLRAVYGESQLSQDQRIEFQSVVAPHLRYMVAESGVNPREIKRYLNAYTLGLKIKPHLDRKIVLALQTIAFRRDWEVVRRAVLSYRGIFTDALRRQLTGNDTNAITDLDPSLTGIPDSFFSYVSPHSPGENLLNASNLDEYIYSGEATRSSLGPMLLDAIRDVAQLNKLLRAITPDQDVKANEVQAYISAVRTALASTQSLGDQRLREIAQNWTDHLNTAGSPRMSLGDEEDVNKTWLTEEESLIRREINQLMQVYQIGSLATPS